MNTVSVLNANATRKGFAKSVVLRHTEEGLKVVQQNQFSKSGFATIAEPGDIVITMSTTNTGLKRSVERVLAKGLEQDPRWSFNNVFAALPPAVQDYVADVTASDGLLPKDFRDEGAYTSYMDKEGAKFDLEKLKGDFLIEGMKEIDEAYTGQCIRIFAGLLVDGANAVDKAVDKVPLQHDEVERVFQNYALNSAKIFTSGSRAIGRMLNKYADKFYPN